MGSSVPACLSRFSCGGRQPAWPGGIVAQQRKPSGPVVGTHYYAAMTSNLH